MIFILLGIVVLIAAFVIALVSLIREQKNSSVFTHPHERPFEPEEKAEEKEVVTEKQSPSAEAEKSFKPEEREPFPWEIAESENKIVAPLTLGKDEESEPKFNTGPIAEVEKEEAGESETPSAATQAQYNPSLPSGGVVEIFMKDMIDRAKNSEGS